MYFFYKKNKRAKSLKSFTKYNKSDKNKKSFTKYNKSDKNKKSFTKYKHYKKYKRYKSYKESQLIVKVLLKKKLIYKFFLDWYYKNYSKKLSILLKQFINKNIKNNLIYNSLDIQCIFIQNLKNLNANFFVNFICLKLSQNIYIYQVLKETLNLLNKLYYIKSYKIIIAGRFSRKQRATYLIETSKYREIPFSSTSEYIDYYSNIYITRNGCCNIKIYIKYISSYIAEHRVLNNKKY